LRLALRWAKNVALAPFAASRNGTLLELAAAFDTKRDLAQTIVTLLITLCERCSVANCHVETGKHRRNDQESEH
jgi:hypothetical protein